MEKILTQKTILTYFDDSHKTEANARVLSIQEVTDKGISVILDQTIFYPQGGGQPSDKGEILTSATTFQVNDVRLIDGIVHHFGNFSKGIFNLNEEVTLKIDSDLRLLHTKLHSAGHLIDAAIRLIELPLVPTKGYHFPQGPYVEYEGEIPPDQREIIRLRLEQKVNDLVANKFETEVMINAQPSTIEISDSSTTNDKAIRIVTLVPELGCPCGGTHVKNTGDIGQVQITKIRVKSGQTRISYLLT